MEQSKVLFLWNLNLVTLSYKMETNPLEVFLFQVRGLPTLFFVSPDPSKDAIRTEGLIPIQMMRDIIDNEM